MGSVLDDAAWTPDVLDPESDQIREVYAGYGAAMYFAQVLEHGLVNFVAAARSGVQIHSLGEYDALLSELFAMTMGRQLQRVLEEANLDEDQIGRLREALKRRNFLAHDYFRECALKMLTLDGRNEMLRELEEIRAHLAAADSELEILTLATLKLKGVTPAMVAAELERMKDDAQKAVFAARR